MLCASAARADNPIWSPYQQYASVNCSTAGACQIPFPAVTKETLILQATCFFNLNQSSSAIYASIFSPGPLADAFLPYFSSGTLEGPI